MSQRKFCSLARLLTIGAFSLFSVGGLASCDEEPEPEDAGRREDAQAPSCPSMSAIEDGDPTGHREPLLAPAGQVRAGRLHEEQLPQHDSGLLRWTGGDYVLASDRFALVIEDAGPSDGYDPEGGRPIGMARVEGGALVEPADFNEMLLSFGGFLVKTETVSVIADGSDGGPAIVRARGPLARVEFTGVLLDALNRGDYTGLPAAMDYVLEPGADHIEVLLRLRNDRPEVARASYLALMFFQRYRMPNWVPGRGFVDPEGTLPYMAFVEDRGTSFAYSGPEDAPLMHLLDASGVDVFTPGSATAAGCAETTFPLGRILIGSRPGLNGLRPALARLYEEPAEREVRVRVLEADGAASGDAGLFVHATHPELGHLNRAPLGSGADPVGEATLVLPRQPLQLWAYREGFEPVGPLELSAEAGEAEIRMPPRAWVEVEVRHEATGELMPARVQTFPLEGGAPAAPGEWGMRRFRAGRSHVAFPTSGRITLPVPPGAHRVVVSRGYAYELHEEEVRVAAGETAHLSARLPQVVRIEGEMCADTHIHSHRSPDSADDGRLKLAAIVADGLELPVRTEHEWVDDYQETILSMGLARWARGVGGEELTTFAYGHFTVLPLQPWRNLPGHGAIPWTDVDPPALFARVDERPERPLFGINHPRGTAIGGYLDYVGYDPETGTTVRPEHWSENFDAMEVFNAASFDDNRDVEVRDWFSLLSQGRHVTALGASDTHGIWTKPAGYPRTCARVGTNDPREVTPNDLRDALLLGRATISGGIYLEVEGPGGERPGDTVEGAGAETMLRVRVWAASWIRPTELELWVDGALIETLPIAEEGPDGLTPALRFDADVRVPVGPSRSWAVLHARGEGDLSPVHPGRRPFAASNPVYLRR